MGIRELFSRLLTPRRVAFSSAVLNSQSGFTGDWMTKWSVTLLAGHLPNGG